MAAGFDVYADLRQDACKDRYAIIDPALIEFIAEPGELGRPGHAQATAHRRDRRMKIVIYDRMPGKYSAFHPYRR